MKAIILAGGIGSRIDFKDIPKPMYKINEKPILEHNILLLKKHGITEICIPLHHKGKTISDYFKDGASFGVKIQYSIEEELLGTSGALKSTEWFINKNESFFIIYGDNYTNIDLSKMLKFHNSAKPISTIALFDPQKSLNSGIAGGVLQLDKNNNVISFIEGKKGEKGYVNAGVYILEPRILDFISPGISDFGKNIFPKLLNEGESIKGFLTDGFVIAIDTKEALENANKAMEKLKLSKT